MKKNELLLDENNIKLTLNKDVLKRKPKLMRLIKLLNVLEDNYTISIDGNWGVGKTFFIKQLLYLGFNNDGLDYIDNKEDEKNIDMFKNKYIPIYYNAWENDDHSNIVESLIYSILDVYPEYGKDISNKKQDFNKIVKPILIKIIEKGSLGFISKDAINEIKSFEDLSKSIITNEEKKQGLNEIFDILTSNNARILLIIDELDRCKPDYAVKVLETIKHFYNYKNITSLVVTNNNQLSESVKHFYGYNFDGYGYLNKMYDTVLTLNTNHLDKYLDEYLEFSTSSNLPKEVTYFLIKYFDFSLRECNSFVSMYNISFRYINLTKGFNSNEYLPYSCVFLPIGLALKIKDINEYKKYIKGKSNELIRSFVAFIKEQDEKNRFASTFNSVFDLEENEKLEDELIKQYHQVVNPSKYDIDTYPFLEALSLLGNLVDYGVQDDNKVLKEP